MTYPCIKIDNFGSDKSIHTVGDYQDFMGGYYHKSNYGFGHWALYDDMPGRKLWLWSTARDGGIWGDLLTDTDGQYMEFQAGRTFNQHVQNPYRSPIKEMGFNPTMTDRWKEIWFPIKDIGGMQEVSPLGVLNVKNTNGNLQIGINSLSFVKAKLIIKSNGKTLLSEDKTFKPMDVFTKTIPLASGADYEIVVEGMDLSHSSINKTLIKRPFATNIPDNESSASKAFQAGLELKENRDFNGAKKGFKKALFHDPLHIDAMAAMSELYYRSNQTDSALYFSNQALQLNAYHPGANYFAGINYQAKGDFINALETFGWAARSMEFRSAAYAQMANIEFQLKNWNLTEHYAQQSLDFNRYNLNALKVMAVLYRTLGNNEMADKTLKNILEIDPLSHFALFEQNLLHPATADYSAFQNTIKNEFPYQTYLEICLDYANLGVKNDALKVLEKAPNHPLITIWQAYLSQNETLLTKAVTENPSYAFPYRTEDVEALKWAVSKNSNWKLKYYLGLNYWAIDRLDDATSLFQSCEMQPDFAPFYTSRAFLLKGINEKQVLIDLQKAKQIAPEDWRNWAKLIDYHDAISDNKTALILSKESAEKFKNNFNLALQYARVLLNNDEYSESIKTLEKTNIIPFEGSLQGKYVFEQAHMSLAINLIQKKDYKQALIQLSKSKTYPENLGIGAPYEPDVRLQNYLEAICLDKLGRSKEAEILRGGILNFTKTHYKDLRPTFNNLLALWIYQKKGETTEASQLIQKIKDSDQYKKPIQSWIVALFNKDTNTADALEKVFLSNNYYKIVKKIQDLAK